MSDSITSAIRALSNGLSNSQGLSDSKRADLIVDAMTLIHDKMGLEFTESLLDQQLKSIKQERAFITFINVLGLALYRKVHYELAIKCFLFRIDLNKKDKIAYNNLGLCYNRQGKSTEAAAAYQGGLDADPFYKQAGSNLLYLQHYIWGKSAQEVSQQHRKYAEMHYRTAENAMPGRELNLDPAKVIKLGFLSGDMRFHAVSRFVTGLFTDLDRSQFELFVYHTYSGLEDGITGILKTNPVTWKRVHQNSVNEIAQLIEQDGVDILMDLAVYTQGGLPDLLARQVAPIQINFMGYPDTSGIPAINYRITDAISDPQGVDHLYSEKLLRLPIPLWNYTPWPNFPEPHQSPHLTNGYITFGSMNNHAKLQNEWMEVWAKVLLAVKNSKLLIKSRAMGSKRIVEDVYQLFEKNGVNRDRLIVKAFEPAPNDHFVAFHDIDICLDSVPYNGTTTTFDSLWLGVPVVTMSGDLHVNRTSASILSGMGLTDWIAKSSEEFIEICVRHARDSSRLADFRYSLRSRMQQTTLGDAAAYCRHFEKLLRDTWRQYCETPLQKVVPSPRQVSDSVNVTEQPSIRSIGSTQPEISIVVCAKNQQHLDASRNHLTETVGAEWEFLGIDNSSKQYSLAEAYNTAGMQSIAPVIAFIHDDVFIASPDWGRRLCEKFSMDEELGLIGLAGTSLLQARYPFWVASKAPFIYGQVIHHNTQIKVSRYSDVDADKQVVAIDGLIMVTSRDAFRSNQFDAEMFDGFHFYDLDFSVRVSKDHKVIVTQDILAKHLSGGSFDQSWKRYRDKFRAKYPKDKIWRCEDGEPDPEAHKQRLSCHFPLTDYYSSEQVKSLTGLGIKHPRHPEFQSSGDN